MSEIERLQEDKKSLLRTIDRLGVCITCVLGAPDTFGCTDCLNTGWAYGEDPFEIIRRMRLALRFAAAQFRYYEQIHTNKNDVEKAQRNAEWATRCEDAAELGGLDYQRRAWDWLNVCFNDEVAISVPERNHRFLEEALELVQAGGCTADQAHELVDYVFNRPIGELAQEVGGVMVCLAVLCQAHGVDMVQCAEDELASVWTKMERIRAKRASKPEFSPLPGAAE